MLDFNDKYLAEIEKYLLQSRENSWTVTEEDLDPKEIVYQIIDQVKQNRYDYNGVACTPNIITISIPETKAEKVEDLEMIFNGEDFLRNFEAFLANQGLSLFNPIRVEVQTVSKGNSRVMYRRAAFALDWPGQEMASEDVLVVVNMVQKKITSVSSPAPQIPQLARLTAHNAVVYQNQYLITKPIIYIGRMRSVVNEQTGKLIRRNDFVFAHLESPEALSNSVSRQHATIFYRNNAFYVLDHGSANGTAIQRGGFNAEEFLVTSNYTQGVKLEHRDILRFGSAWVSFELVSNNEMQQQSQSAKPAEFLTEPVHNTGKVNNLTPEERFALENSIKRLQNK
ncbi:MAG: FHA domain-containing protein [Acidobacteria bacterium]|nr:FHA domain-containing protein [Acidobacteriota bacterium]